MWVLFLGKQGQVLGAQKISQTEGDFGGTLHDEGEFGVAVAELPDMNGNGYPELVVGEHQYLPAAGNGNGRIWILELGAGGVVLDEHPIELSDLEPSTLFDTPQFGGAVCTAGPIYGDGVIDLVVGSPDLDNLTGAIWIVRLSTSTIGAVVSHAKIGGQAAWGNMPPLQTNGFFGSGVTSLGDLDGDGVGDIAVGQPNGYDASKPGSVWILFMKADGTVDHWVEITEGQNGFDDDLDPNGWFGVGLVCSGDVDGDGVVDLAVSDYKDGGEGALWSLFLDTDGTVKGYRKVGTGAGCFTGPISTSDCFGYGLGVLDRDWTTRPVLGVGASCADTGGNSAGAVWLLELNALGDATPGTWLDLGHGLPAGDSPVLSGQGPLLGETMFSISIDEGLSFGAAHLVIGLSLLLAPFKGGVLVPFPHEIIYGRVLDTAGSWTVEEQWPCGIPSGSAIYMQSWHPDGAGPKGFKASNALCAQAP